MNLLDYMFPKYLVLVVYVLLSGRLSRNEKKATRKRVGAFGPQTNERGRATGGYCRRDCGVGTWDDVPGPSPLASLICWQLTWHLVRKEKVVKSVSTGTRVPWYHQFRKDKKAWAPFFYRSCACMVDCSRRRRRPTPKPNLRERAHAAQQK